MIPYRLKFDTIDAVRGSGLRLFYSQNFSANCRSKVAIEN